MTDTPESEGPKPNPWAKVLCYEHGPQGLTYDQYMCQLADADHPWTCPVCGESAVFDDSAYEEIHNIT